MNTPQISAIIPTCDRPQFLPEAIASIRAQSLQPIEIIVANNGKEPLPEGSLGDDVKILNLEPYVGVSAARNAGAEAAQGDYLAFLDDDDKWDEEFLEHLAKKMASANADYVVADKYYLFEKEEPRLHKSFTHYPKGTKTCFYGKNPGFGGGNFLVSKIAFFDVGGFDKTITLSEDQVLACELMLKGYKIVGEPKAKYYGRVHTKPRLTNYSTPKRKNHFYRDYMQFYHKLKQHMTLKQRVIYVFKGWIKVFKHKIRSVLEF